MSYTLTGTFLYGDGSPRVGRVKFTASTTVVGADSIILPAPLEVDLDAAGSFTVDLVGTDDPAYSPSGWLWTITESMRGGRDAWSFELTADADLSDLSPTVAPGTYDAFALLATDMIAGAGLTGGGTLAADRTFTVGAGTGITVNADDVEVAYGTTVGTAAQGNDPRLSDARTPTAHAASHGSAGSDAVTVAESQVTGLTAALAAKAPLASPTFTGTPAAPTAATGTNTTQLATTAFVAGKITVDRPNTDDVRVRVRGADGTLQTVHYDSGWRDVTALLINGWTVGASGYVYMRRTLNDLQFAINALRDDAPATSNNVMLMPTGFAALTTNTRGQAIGNWNYTKFLPTAVNGGYLNLPKGLGGVEYYGSFIIPAAATFSAPTSLPGTLVSSAPA